MTKSIPDQWTQGDETAGHIQLLSVDALIATRYGATQLRWMRYSGIKN